MSRLFWKWSIYLQVEVFKGFRSNEYKNIEY